MKVLILSTAEEDLRSGFDFYKLGKFFKQSPQFWFNIQTNCDFRRLMKQAHRITAKVKGDFTKLAA